MNGWIKIIGIMSLLSYTSVILATWMYSNLIGYTYFSAGEENLVVKYIEWVMGIGGLLIGCVIIKENVKELEREERVWELTKKV